MGLSGQKTKSDLSGGGYRLQKTMRNMEQGSTQPLLTPASALRGARQGPESKPGWINSLRSTETL